MRRRLPAGRGWAAVASVGAALSLAACGAAANSATTTTHPAHPSSKPAAGAHPTTTAPHASTTTAAPPSSTRPPTTSSSKNLPAPGPGFVSGHVTAIGDSVMIDYQQPLQNDVPGVTVDATVSRQWSDGEAILQQLKAQGQLGAVVIVALSTNGPISSGDFDSMMSILSGASRVVFVNVHVDQPWQDPNNAVLSAGVARYHNTVLVDWQSLAAANPGWFGSDGTHLSIGGQGAQELASLIASKV